MRIKLICIMVFSIWVLLLLIFPGCGTQNKKKSFLESEWDKQVEDTRLDDLYAPHFKNGRFFAPWHKMKDKNFLDVLEWKLFSRTSYSAAEKNYLPEVLPDTFKRLKETPGDFILWIGHNTFLIRVSGVYWLTDPIFSKRALLPARLTPPALTLAEFTRNFDKVNVIISHNHYDHLDKKSISHLPADTQLFVPLGLKNMINGWGLENVTQMDWWQEIRLENDIQLVCLPAQHWSLRIGQGRNTTLWASWLLVTPDHTFYFGGDSGYFKGFREFGKKFHPIDYAFMATTAYHPRWFMHYQHMNIEEAVKGFNELGARVFIPTQWGTFHLGDEPAGYPGLDLKRYIEKNHLDPDRFRIMDIGQILPIGTDTKEKSRP